MFIHKSLGQGAIRWAVCTVLVLRSSVACDPNNGAGDAGTSDASTLQCDSPRKATWNSAYVVNGTRLPSLVPLSEQQQRAVVYLDMGCSGTLISDQVVLTAHHCTDGQRASGVRVAFGPDDSNPLWSCGVSEIINHSSLDLALLVLDQRPVEHVDVMPIPINTLELDSTWIGEHVEAAGFGLTSPAGGADGRFFVAEPIYALGSTTLSVNGEGIHGVCFGDSGGPVMGLVGEGAVRVLGALSHGDSSCTGIDVFTRVDPAVSWIEDQTGMTPSLGPVACGSITPVGRCESEQRRAIYCSQDLLQRDDCEAQGMQCGYDVNAQGYRCMAPGTDPCQGLDGLGRCDEYVSRWCVDGVVQQFDCGACRMSCAWVNDAIGFDCVEDPCFGLDFLGRCDGDVAEWCNSGEVQRVDCTDYDQRCGYVDEDTGYYCLD